MADEVGTDVIAPKQEIIPPKAVGDQVVTSKQKDYTFAAGKKIGRPRGAKTNRHIKHFEDEFRKQLLRLDGDGVRPLQRIVRTVVQKAIDGDMRAAEFIIERIDGKLPTPIQGDQTGAPIAISVTIGGVDR